MRGDRQRGRKLRCAGITATDEKGIADAPRRNRVTLLVVTTKGRRAGAHMAPPWYVGTRRLLDTVFPPKCAGCSARGGWLCSSCLALVQPLTLPACGVCDAPIHPAEPHGCGTAGVPLLSISAVGVYAGPLRASVHALKYGGRHGIAATLAALLAPRLEPLLAEGDLLIPAPLHPTRERERGYNQSAILATELARLLPLEPAPAALRRVRATADQTTLTGPQRAANMRGAFAGRPDLVRNRCLWLLDDVSTTGSTLRAAARALRAAGALEVRGAVIAMTNRG